METRNISTIAWDIKRDWKKIYFGAIPYLNAMLSLDTITDNYVLEDAKTIITRFLANAGTYRGENAKKYKSELKKLAGIK